MLAVPELYRASIRAIRLQCKGFGYIVYTAIGPAAHIGVCVHILYRPRCECVRVWLMEED